MHESVSLIEAARVKGTEDFHSNLETFTNANWHVHPYFILFPLSKIGGSSYSHRCVIYEDVN